MPDIASRLKATRESLGLSQQALAEHCGVTARSQRNYEAGERQPDAEYLARLLELGVDVAFVLAGERRGSQPSTDPAELVLLDNYRRCSLAGKQDLLQKSVLLAAGISSAKLTSPKPKAQVAQPIRQKAAGDGNVQIGSIGGNYESPALKSATRNPKTR